MDRNTITAAGSNPAATATAAYNAAATAYFGAGCYPAPETEAAYGNACSLLGAWATWRVLRRDALGGACSAADPESAAALAAAAAAGRRQSRAAVLAAQAGEYYHALRVDRAARAARQAYTDHVSRNGNVRAIPRDGGEAARDYLAAITASTIPDGVQLCMAGAHIVHMVGGAIAAAYPGAPMDIAGRVVAVQPARGSRPARDVTGLLLIWRGIRNAPEYAELLPRGPRAALSLDYIAARIAAAEDMDPDGDGGTGDPACDAFAARLRAIGAQDLTEAEREQIINKIFQNLEERQKETARRLMDITPAQLAREEKCNLSSVSARIKALRAHVRPEIAAMYAD